MTMHRPRIAHARRAFTLTEVVLSIGLALGLMGTLLWFYQHAADTRDTIGQDLDRLQQRRLVMDRVTEQLRGAMSHRFLNIGLEGQTDRVTFIAARLPGNAAWAVRDGTDDFVPPEQDVVLTSFALRIEEDEDGYGVIRGVEMQTQKLIATETAEEGEGIESALLSSDFLFVRFRYWDDEGQAWLDTWEEGGIPKAIEVAFGYEPLEEDAEPIDYPHELVSRVIYLPGAAEPQDGLEELLRSLGAP